MKTQLKYKLRLLVAIVLVAVTASRVDLRALAKTKLTESITTSGGLTVKYTDDLTAEEAQEYSVDLANEDESFAVSVSYGSDVLPGRGIQSAEEAWESLLGSLSDDFIIDTDDAEQIELDNGTGILQPYEFGGSYGYFVFLDTNDGSLLFGFVYLGGEIDDDQYNLALEITGSASYDAADCIDCDEGGFDGSDIIGGGDKDDTDADADVEDDSDNGNNSEVENTIFFSEGAQISIPEGWEHADEEVTDQAVLHFVDSDAITMTISFASFESEEEVETYMGLLLPIYASTGNDPNLDPDDPFSFAPDLETYQTDDGRNIAIYQNDMVVVIFVDLGDNYLGTVVATTYDTDAAAEFFDQMDEGTRAVAESFIFSE
ncbi:MAG: hypothetical protein KF726_21920 [Anaerolineae bacterium]|nr:hypothetical protein [Anaerolineae bacterium]